MTLATGTKVGIYGLRGPSPWSSTGPRRSRSKHVAIRVPTILAATALLYQFDPTSTWWFPSCPLYALTGWLCPFCGSLRALHALLHGAPLVALGLNPLTTCGAAVGAVAVAMDAFRTSERGWLGRLTRLGFSAYGAAAILTFGVLRNLVGR